MRCDAKELFCWPVARDPEKEGKQKQPSINIIKTINTSAIIASKYTEILHLRDLSCLDLCSLLLNARLQNWHLYFFCGFWRQLFGVLRGAKGGESINDSPLARSTISSWTTKPSAVRVYWRRASWKLRVGPGCVRLSSFTERWLNNVWLASDGRKA